MKCIVLKCMGLTSCRNGSSKWQTVLVT